MTKIVKLCKCQRVKQDPTPILSFPLKGKKHCSLPFKGRAGVGMG